MIVCGKLLFLVELSLYVSMFDQFQYVVIPQSPTEQEILLQQSLSDSDSDYDESVRSVEFRELFSLPPAECPLTGKVPMVPGSNPMMSGFRLWDFPHKRGEYWLCL